MERVVNICTPSDIRRLRVDKTAHYRLTRDIDMEGKIWNPVGNGESPFTGILDGNGFKISNLVMPYSSSDGNVGIVSRNQGLIRNLYLENITVIADEKACHVGTFAGINDGEIIGCRVSGKIVGGSTIAGVNCGKIENCLAEAEVTGGAGLVGELADGQVLGCEMAGKADFALVGKMTSGLISNCLITQEQAPAIEEKADGEADYSYLDLSHSDDNLTSGQYDLRRKAVEHMYRMASYEWSPDVTLEWNTVYGHNTVSQTYQAGKTYHGMPYTNKDGSFERFLACFNPDGTLKDFIKEIPKGYDGFDLYMGSDCSGGVYWAWNRIGCSFSFRFTGDAMPLEEGGTLPVGDYAFEPGMETDQIRDRNGEQGMAQSYAKLYLGDAILQRTKKGGGHIRLVSKTPVIYRKNDGSIDLDNSYILTHELGGNLGGWRNLEGWDTPWLTDHRYTFRDLYNTHYIPITIRELQEGVCPEATLDAQITGINCGVVRSNWRIISTTAKVFADGEEVWSDRVFTAVHPFDEESGDTIARTTVREVDLQAHRDRWSDDLLKPGKRYTYQVEVLLGNGQTLSASIDV